jgi:hypothetical protein
MTSANVFFINSNCFEQNTIKVAISPASGYDVTIAHKDIYCSDDGEPDICIVDEIRVEDKSIFQRYLDKMSRDLAHRNFFQLEAKDKIIHLIQLVNNLNSFDEQSKISTLPDHNLIIGSTNFEYGQYVNNSVFVPSTHILEIKDSFDLPNEATTWSPSFNRFVLFNKGYGYNVDLLRELFPEFILAVYENFPNLSLAEDMLWYKFKHMYSNDHREVAKIIQNIRVFFEFQSPDYQDLQSTTVDADINDTLHPVTNIPNVDNASIDDGRLKELTAWNTSSNFAVTSTIPDLPVSDGLSANDLLRTNYASPFKVEPTPYQVIASSTPWNQVTIHAERKIFLKEFVDKRCYSYAGAKIKSSNLFELFKKYYASTNSDIPFEKIYNQTSFTLILKEISNFETKREKDGIYWINLYVSDFPPPHRFSDRPASKHNKDVPITKVHIDFNTLLH